MIFRAAVVRSLLVLGLAGAALAFEAVRLRSRTEAPKDVPAPKTAVDCTLQLRRPPPGLPNALTDVTEALGIDFRHAVGPLGTYFMPESIGAGGALLDFDGDGRLDVFLVNCGRSPHATGELPPGTRSEDRLFRQKEDGTFEDVTHASGLPDKGYGAGCAAGDVDNDGDVDLFVANYGTDALYLNDGRGGFSDVAADAGITEGDWGVCAAFFDYDRDGLLDLFVVNYTADPTYGHSVACGFRHGLVSYCGPHKFSPTVDRLYHNESVTLDHEGRRVVRFRDVTEEVGISAATTYGFGVVCADFTGDGWPDVFVANDGAPNRLWVNGQNGTFREEAVARGAAVNAEGESEAGMGVAAGDVDGDGATDLVVTHLSQETATLYLGGDGVFTDATRRRRLDAPTRLHTGWGTALVDLDHDGSLDLPIVNGLVVPCHSRFPFHGEDQFQTRHDVIEDPDAFWRDYADANVLLLGDREGEFREAAGGDFCAAEASGRSLIAGDLDEDGDIDLLVTNCGGSARVYRNDFPKQGSWLTVRAFDPALARDAYGAVITVEAGGRRFVGSANPGYGYLASNDPRAHFGLGRADDYERIVVRWPDGPVETAAESFPGGPAGRHLTLRRGEGRPVTDPSKEIR